MTNRVDLDPALVERRLRRLAELADAQRAADRASGAMRRAAYAARRGAVVDLSPPAVDRRLRELSELSHLCRSLSGLGRR